MLRLEIATCPNQDPLEATTGLFPLFGKDQLDDRMVFIKSDVKHKVGVMQRHTPGETGDLAIDFSYNWLYHPAWLL